MAKRIIVAGLAGWAGIVALAWWLAAQRIELCSSGTFDTFTAESNCVIRTTAARDSVLFMGLTVALVALIVAALVMARSSGRLNGWVRANQAGATRLN